MVVRSGRLVALSLTVWRLSGSVKIEYSALVKALALIGGVEAIWTGAAVLLAARRLLKHTLKFEFQPEFAQKDTPKTAC